MLSLIPQLLLAQAAKQSGNELPNTTSRPGHLHIPSSTENPQPSPSPSLNPLRVHFSQCSQQLQPFLPPSINHCYNLPFPPSGRAVACPAFPQSCPATAFHGKLHQKEFCTIHFVPAGCHCITNPVLRTIIFPLA